MVYQQQTQLRPVVSGLQEANSKGAVTYYKSLNSISPSARRLKVSPNDVQILLGFYSSRHSRMAVLHADLCAEKNAHAHFVKVVCSLALTF